MAGVPFQTTVAAPEQPFLRESVNAVPGPRVASIETAKGGNATPYRVFPYTRQLQMLCGAIVGAPADPEAFG